MLVLSRKVGERILVGDQITITVVRVNNGGVRLGIEAPGDLVVVREEVAKENPHSLRRERFGYARRLPKIRGHAQEMGRFRRSPRN